MRALCKLPLLASYFENPSSLAVLIARLQSFVYARSVNDKDEAFSDPHL